MKLLLFFCLLILPSSSNFSPSPLTSFSYSSNYYLFLLVFLLLRIPPFLLLVSLFLLFIFLLFSSSDFRPDYPLDLHRKIITRIIRLSMSVLLFHVFSDLYNFHSHGSARAAVRYLPQLSCDKLNLTLHLWNVGLHVRNYTAPYPRKLSSTEVKCFGVLRNIAC
jgi:hypothetical protein